MHASQLIQNIFRIERCVDQAARLCSNNDHSDQELKAYLTSWEETADEVSHMLNKRFSQNDLSRRVQRLEEVGGRVIRVCDQLGTVDSHLLQLIHRACREIAQLKHQLH